MNVAWNHSVNSRNELKIPEIGLGGRQSLDFGIVRTRVQIPGPRPISEQVRQPERCSRGNSALFQEIRLGSALQIAPRLAYLGDMPVIRAAAAADHIDLWQMRPQRPILQAKLDWVALIDFGCFVDVGVTLA